MVPTVRGSRAVSQGILHYKVRENRSTRMRKLTKMQKKILNCSTQTAFLQQFKVHIFFLLALPADYLYLHF